MGLEILEQAPDVEAVVVPVGGGGLHRRHRHGDERARARGAGHRRRAGGARRASPPRSPPASPRPSTLAAHARRRPRRRARRRHSVRGDRHVVDRVVTVDEAAIALAILRLIELEKSVVEGAGATPLAALIAGKLPDLAGRKVVLTLCGGNIDTNMLGRVLDVGLVADGRLTRFTVSVARPARRARAPHRHDRPGRRLDPRAHARPRVLGPAPLGSARRLRRRDHRARPRPRAARGAAPGRLRGERLAVAEAARSERRRAAALRPPRGPRGPSGSPRPTRTLPRNTQ